MAVLALTVNQFKSLEIPTCFRWSGDDIMVNELSVVGEECGETGTDRGHAPEGPLEDVVTDGSGTWQELRGRRDRPCSW